VNNPTLSLKDKCAIITGASTGIGAAIATAYAQAGAKVVINYEPGTTAPDEMLAKIKADGGQAIAVAADISDVAQHHLLIDAALNTYGRLDILVNNAAVLGGGQFFGVTEETWDRTNHINLKGPYFLTQAITKLMVERETKGRIINVTSTHAFRPNKIYTVYTISKAGLEMLTRSLALELAEFGITVNSVVPGAVNTAMSGFHNTPERRQKAADKVPLGRGGEPDDLVGAALFLASDGAEYITGADIKVNGGFGI
jgi:NAD(P)-dependent dehydrogenase (short-subunit alcohol dehydrogenase family)